MIMTKNEFARKRSKPRPQTSPLRACVGLGIALLSTAAVGASIAVSVPPEPRVTIPAVDLPENAMTRANVAARAAALTAPITDAAGRKRYIVDLDDKATDGYPKTVANLQDDLPSWHKPEMRNLAAAMGQQYAFRAVAVTSWVGNSFTAFLSDAQVDTLRADPRVTRISVDRKVPLSTPLWSDSYGQQWQIISWGANAIGQRTSPSGAVQVYVLDAGVGLHQDLQSNTTRYAANYGINAVGCYPHATHVAGIIGANGTVQNSSLGVDAGVPIVSVAVGDTNRSGSGCSDGNSDSGFATGLDLIKSLIVQAGRVGVVNISANGAAFTASGTIGQKMINLATPVPPGGGQSGNPGAFIVQSAGNSFADACNVA
jgi:hypothetical protein